MLKAQENTRQDGGTRADQAPGRNYNMKNYELSTGKTFEELKTIVQKKTDTVVGDFDYIAKNSILVQKEQQTIQTNSVIKPENNNYFYKDQQLDIVPNFNLKLYQKLLYYINIEGIDVEDPLLGTSYSDPPQLRNLDFKTWDYSKSSYGVSKAWDRVLKVNDIQLNKDLINGLNLCTPDETYNFFYASKKNKDNTYSTSTINNINSESETVKYTNFFGHFTLSTPGYENDAGNVTSYQGSGILSFAYSQAENNSENEQFYPVRKAADAYPGEQKYPQGLPIGRGIYMIPKNITIGRKPRDQKYLGPVFCFVLGIERTPEV